ncbi:hypothetical protein E2562_010564 [Oryza meyeriana var. granulata]|uniref:Jacalin-type lectin domain-containing protein n=1 Tax=Oryza meyeriana var. granulata TaxID=110450 RepID=A0A6G1BU97_9ORYZ|nr:hypothetical protein E2562_010564 [Oryza meyeriana var. granulata]
MEMVERRFSWLAVLIIVIVSISIYTCAFVAGVTLGRALERRKPVALDVVDDGHGAMVPTRRSSAVKKVGPWGGSGGWYDFGIRTVPRRLSSITLYHSNGAIHSLSFNYYIQQEGGDELKLVKNGPWGQSSSFDSIAVRETIMLSADEQVSAVEGTVGHFRDVVEPVITSLTFRTNAGRTYGPYGGTGDEQGTPFSIPADKGSVVVGFWGRAGWLLDSIGVYVSIDARAP